jgi:hypothetical protein
MKNQFSIHDAVGHLSPAFYEIWLHISRLKFDTNPDYAFIIEKLEEVMRANGIADDDEYDWGNVMEEYRRTLAAAFGFTPRVADPYDMESCQVGAYYTELGPSPVIMQEINRPGMKSPLVRPQGRNYSIMQKSELNEGVQRQCCC